MEKGFILSLIFAAIVAVFALNNANKVMIDFLFKKVEISQAIIIFASALLGAITVSILGGIKNLKFRKEIKDLNKRIDFIQEERDNLKLLLEKNEENVEEDKPLEEDLY